MTIGIGGEKGQEEMKELGRGDKNVPSKSTEWLLEKTFCFIVFTFFFLFCNFKGYI